MAGSALKNIFLSASVPLAEGNDKYYRSTDIIAIRDAVISLATVVLPKYRIVWGGHPSITPLIYFVMQTRGLNIQDHVKLYQSEFFRDKFPVDNDKFNNVEYTRNTGDAKSSVLTMRETLFAKNKFHAGVFIGGMEGIEDEFKMFRDSNPHALLVPLASTGGAAKIVYEQLLPPQFRNDRFVKEYAYMSLFQELLDSQ